MRLKVKVATRKEALFGLDKESKFVKLVKKILHEVARPLSEEELRSLVLTEIKDTSMMSHLHSTLETLKNEHQLLETNRGWMLRTSHRVRAKIELDTDPYADRETAREDQQRFKTLRNKLNYFFHDLLNNFKLSDIVKQKGAEVLLNPPNAEIMKRRNEMGKELRNYLEKQPEDFKNRLQTTNLSQLIQQKVIASPTKLEARLARVRTASKKNWTSKMAKIHSFVDHKEWVSQAMKYGLWIESFNNGSKFDTAIAVDNAGNELGMWWVEWLNEGADPEKAEEGLDYVAKGVLFDTPQEFDNWEQSFKQDWSINYDDAS
jgi:hypothetical protein